MYHTDAGIIVNATTLNKLSQALEIKPHIKCCLVSNIVLQRITFSLNVIIKGEGDILLNSEVYC